MPRSMLFAVVTLAATAAAQNTVPIWSTTFGGNGNDEIRAVHRDPGGVVTVTGITTSTTMPPGTANPSPAQPAFGGGYSDAFVARLDPSLPPNQQLLWSTYLGGSGVDIAFDLAVDPSTGVTTVVGVTTSTDFPGALGQPSPVVNGGSDGFLVQIDPTGSVLLASMLVGGSDHDRILDVELENSGVVVIAGNTESADLPWTAGTVQPTHMGLGYTDAFVAKVVPNASGGQGLWATYVGSDRGDGVVFANYLANYQWVGNLDRMSLTVDDNGSPALVTTSNVGVTPSFTTPNALQAAPAGGGEVYLVALDANGSSILYATYFGGTAAERPKGIVRHPDGGFVIAGWTGSSDLPVTAGCIQSTFQSCAGGCLGIDIDGFVCHIDPALGASGLRYSTFFGTNRGEDYISDVKVESSGMVTVAGYCIGGANFMTTPRSMLESTTAVKLFGFVSRFAMRGLGSADLLYSSYIGSTTGTNDMCTTVALDELGNAIVAGRHAGGGYPLQNAYQSPVGAFGSLGAITHLPLLPGCVDRSDTALATPACSQPLYTGMGGAPLPGTTCELTATNAPPGAIGALVLGTAAAPTSLPAPFNGNLLVTTGALVFTFADNHGSASFPLTIPAGLSAVCPWGLAAQWMFLTNPACAGSGMVATSGRLEF